MKRRSCRVCGGVIGRGDTSCPYCGTPVGTGISRVWVLTFFVMGVALGLMLLILQQQGMPERPQLEVAQATTTKSRDTTIKSPAPRKVAPKSPPLAAPQPPPATASTTIEPINCDRHAAEAIRDKARTLATITQQGDVVRLNLTRQWDYFTPGHRQSFVETFAEADRCLHGRLRLIRFSYRGEEVAMVSAEGAVQMK